MQEFHTLFKGLIQRQRILACQHKLSLPINGHTLNRRLDFTTSQACYRLFSTSAYRPIAGNFSCEEDEPNQKYLGDQSAQKKEKQARTPWHREGSDVPPVRRQRSAGAMTKGKLLTTPSRLLKLILPLTTLDKNSDRKDVEPLALLVHSQQPLSYLERLIQSELPTIKNAKGEEKVPAIYFRAEDSTQDETGTLTKIRAGEDEDDDHGGLDQIKSEAESDKTGKLHNKLNKVAAGLRGGHGEGGVESYSGQGREGQSTGGHERKFVRWSTSTEIGDFIRDAARGKEFAVEIEGTPNDIRVGVPSFNDRTYYLRSQLRKISRKMMTMGEIKRECDLAAHRRGQRVAFAGFGVLATWWYVVYWLTFDSSYGWDTMEPVTYLVSLSTLMGGYLWFLYHNREVSYRSAMNLTISRRQTVLYQARGFDLTKWESWIEEANALRKEIKAIAKEYDIDYDETRDEQDEMVVKTLKDNRDAKKSKGESGEEKKSDDKD